MSIPKKKHGMVRKLLVSLVVVSAVAGVDQLRRNFESLSADLELVRGFERPDVGQCNNPLHLARGPGNIYAGMGMEHTRSKVRSGVNIVSVASDGGPLPVSGDHSKMVTIKP